MKWMFMVPDDGTGSVGTQRTIVAENWFAALTAGLSGVGEGPMSNISCIPTADGTVEVRDYVSGRVFYLHPFSELEADIAPTTHMELVGSRDVRARDGAVSYRERVVRVPPGLTTDVCERIARDVLNAHRQPTDDDQLVVAVHVYDHSFGSRPIRPAVVRLAWQQWNPDALQVDYPLSGAGRESTEAANGSDGQIEDAARHMNVDDPFDVEALCSAARSSVEKLEKPGGQIASPGTTDKRLDEKMSLATVEEKEVMDAGAARTEMRAGSRSGQRKASAAANAVDGGVMWAFERLQEMYSILEHDRAADFICGVMMEAIPSEACAVLLNTPGKDELYVSAWRGAEGLSFRSLRVPAIGGIVGAALRLGAVLNVQDPEDERFNVDVDLQGNFAVRNVLVTPVAFEGHPFGVVQMFNREVDAEFDGEDCNVASYVSGAFAEFVSRFLPSREADFTDREFVVPAPQKKTPAASPKASAQSAPVKATSEKPAEVKSKGSGGAPASAQKPSGDKPKQAARKSVPPKSASASGKKKNRKK